MWQFTRPARWLTHAAQGFATLLCAYVPVAQEMSFLPQPLVNVLALLTVLLMLLPGRTSRSGNTDHVPEKQQVAGRRRRVHRVRVRGPVRRRVRTSTQPP